MTSDICVEWKLIVLTAIDPGAVLLAIVDGNLEEVGHIGLKWCVALIVPANALVCDQIVARIPLIPEVGAAAHVYASRGAVYGKRVPIYERDVTVAISVRW